MLTAIPVDSPVRHVPPAALMRDCASQTEDLGEAIAALAARLHAARRTGIDLGAAREFPRAF